MTAPTRAQLHLASAILKGNSNISYDEVAKRYGLDNSFVWTADTFWPYAAEYVREVNEQTTRALKIASITIRLRAMAKTLRTSSMPIKDIIPLLQEAADTLDTLK